MSLQRGAWARYGRAAAAVLVTVILGASCASPGESVGGPGSSTASSSTPTATGPMSLMDSPDSGDLPAGDYYLDLPAYPGRIDFEVPAGWWHFWPGDTRQDSDAHAILVNSEDTGAANGSAWGLAFTVVGEVRVDPCDPLAGTMDSSVTESAEALLEAFSSWEDFPASGVEDVTLGGFSGKRVEIGRGDAVTCDGTFFDTPSGYEFGPIFSATQPSVNQFTLLDVEGSVLVIWATDFPGTTIYEVDGGASPDPEAHVEDQVQLHEILESIAIQAR